LKTLSILTAVIFIFSTAGVCWAQEPEAPEEEEPSILDIIIEKFKKSIEGLAEQKKKEFEFTVLGMGVSGFQKADIDDTEGGSSIRGTSLVFASYPVFAVYQHYRYEWEGIDQLPFGNSMDDPWESLQQIIVGGVCKHDLTDLWKFSIQGAVLFGFEKEMEDSYSFYTGTNFTYEMTERWKLGLGGILYMHSKIESEWPIFPFINFSWNTQTKNGWWFTIGTNQIAGGYRYYDRKDLKFWATLGLGSLELGLKYKRWTFTLSLLMRV
jgi:hypothetical protein